jgi:hypothetical protein
MSATLRGWHHEIYLTIDQGLFVMTFTASNTVEQMILDAAAKLSLLHHTSQGERLVQKELRRTLLKYKLHTAQDLFDKANGYIRRYY